MMRDACPKCFSEVGYTILLKEQNGVLYCSENPRHKFKKTEDGYLTDYKEW